MRFIDLYTGLKDIKDEIDQVFICIALWLKYQGSHKWCDRDVYLYPQFACVLQCLNSTILIH